MARAYKSRIFRSRLFQPRRFNGRSFNTVVNLPDPRPPGANDLLVPANNGLDNLSVPFTSLYGNVIVRIFARNNANSNPGITVTWNGTPLTQCGIVQDSIVGHPYAAIFAIRNGFIGTGNVVITCTIGSAGVAAVRVGEVFSLGNPFVGQVDGQIVNQYYYEAVIDGSNPNNNVTIVAGTMNQNGYPFDSDPNITEQWNTYQSNGTQSMSAFFGNEFEGSHGDPYYVIYPANSQLGAILGVEFLGLVPPP